MSFLAAKYNNGLFTTDMPKFQYEAVSAQGGKRKFRGVIEAQSGEYAILELARRKLYPIFVREMSQTDEVVAGRLINFKRIKNSLSPGAEIAARPLPAPAAPHFRMPWAILGWGAVVAAVPWAISHV